MNKQNHQGDSGTELKLSPDTMHGGYRILAPITCQSITISISHTKRSQVRKKKGQRQRPEALTSCCPADPSPTAPTAPNAAK